MSSKDPALPILSTIRTSQFAIRATHVSAVRGLKSPPAPANAVLAVDDPGRLIEKVFEAS